MKCLRAAFVTGLCVLAHPVLSHAQNAPLRPVLRVIIGRSVDLGELLDMIASQQNKFVLVIVLNDGIDLNAPVYAEDFDLKDLTPEKQLEQVTRFYSLVLTRYADDTFVISKKPIDVPKPAPATK